MASFVELLPEYVQTTAVVAGGIWAYQKFVRQRGDEPATDIDVDLRFVGSQDDQHVVEVTATLENKSLVRLTYRDFRLVLRYVVRGDVLNDGPEKIKHQLECARSIDARIDGESRYFANVDYINPRQRFNHRYITFLGPEAPFAWVQCSLEFQMSMGIWRRMWGRGQYQAVRMNTQRIFRVPTADESAHGRPVLPEPA